MTGLIELAYRLGMIDEGKRVKHPWVWGLRYLMD